MPPPSPQGATRSSGQSTLSAAGKRFVADTFAGADGYPGSSPVPVRLLATAYDQNWRLKKKIPKDAIPAASARNRLSRSTGSLPRQDCLAKSQTHTGSFRGSFRPKPVDTRRSLSVPASPKSPKSPASPASSLSPMWRLNSGKGKDKQSAASPKLILDRPDSPDVEEDEEEKDGKEDEDSLQSAKATTGPGAAIEYDAVDNDAQRDEKPLWDWAGESGVPFDIAKQSLDVFVDFVSNPPPPEFATRKDRVLAGTRFDAGVDLGSMDTEAFGKACLQIADCKDFSSLPDGFLESAMSSADKDGSGDIDFGEFLAFYYKFSFSEEVLIGPQEKQIRRAARENDMSFDEIGKYKYVFDQTDTNKNGKICYDEFNVLICKLLKVPRGHEVPERRLKDMWKEATRQRDDLDFFKFVGWFKRYFIGDGKSNESSGFEAFYHNVRRVSIYDSSLYH